MSADHRSANWSRSGLCGIGLRRRNDLHDRPGTAEADAAKMLVNVIVPQVALEHSAPKTLQAITRVGFELRGSVSAAEKGALVPAVTDGGPFTNDAEGTEAETLEGSVALAAFTDAEAGTGRFPGAM
jgi:hypothetical protein